MTIRQLEKAYPDVAWYRGLDQEFGYIIRGTLNTHYISFRDEGNPFKGFTKSQINRAVGELRQKALK